jgi:hypothetical protein
MSTYDEVLTSVQHLSRDEQARLLETLKILVYSPAEVQGTDELISAEEIAASDTALQDYRTGRDRGLSSQELKRKLFGGSFS